MKTTKRDVLDELDTIVADMFAKADGYLLSAKAYNCRSTEAIKSGLIKGAAVMRIDAAKIQAVIEKYKDQPNGQASAARSTRQTTAPIQAAVAEVSTDPSTQDGTMASGTESSDQDTGPMDLPGMRPDHD